MDPDDLPEEIELLEELQRGQGEYHASWSDGYKLARKYLHGTKDVEQDFSQAFVLFLAEAETGNAFAMYDLGRMCADGLGCEPDPEAAQNWYQKALTAFLAAELTAEERQLPYLWYRIGKMYVAGLGTEQDYASAAEWFSRQSPGITNMPNTLWPDCITAVRVWDKVSSRPSCFIRCLPSREIHMHLMNWQRCFGTGLVQSRIRNGRRGIFKEAFAGFSSLEEESHEDKLQFRLGWMLHTGTGTEKDDVLAAEYWEHAARLGNVHAQYALGKLWMENGTVIQSRLWNGWRKLQKQGTVRHNMRWRKSTGTESMSPQDIEKAVKLFTLSAEQENEYAAYQLGKLYLSGEYLQKDVAEGIRFMETAAEKGNRYAQYAFG